MTREPLDALVLGLPWQRIGSAGVIAVVDRTAAVQLRQTPTTFTRSGDTIRAYGGCRMLSSMQS